MGYKIQPVIIWQNGKQENANFINASIVQDNLKNFANFYWELISIIIDSEGNEIKKTLAQGNTTIGNGDYIVWGESQDINLAAYQYICSQLNLTLIP